MANYENDQLIILFESEPKEPLKLDGQGRFRRLRPDLLHRDRLHRGREHGGRRTCRRAARAAVIRPDPDEAIAQNQATLTDAFFNDPTGTDLSKIFATRLELNCKAEGLDTVNKTTIRIVFALLALAYVLTHFLGHAHAQSSLGIGTNEAIAALDRPVRRLAELDQRAAAGLLPLADRRAEGDARGRQQAVGAGRPVLRLRHLPRRRPRPRQGGDLLLHAGQRGGAEARHHALLRLGLPAGADRDRRHDAGVPGAARHLGLDDRRDLVPRSGELCADHALRRLAAVAEGRAAAASACSAPTRPTACRPRTRIRMAMHGHRRACAQPCAHRA